MQDNEKKSKNLLIINNRTEHVLEEHKQAQTKTTKQQKTDSNLQPQKNGNHELETMASRQNAKQQNRYIEDGSQLKTNEKSETEQDIKIKKKQCKPSINQQLGTCQ